ncbi:Cell-division-associated, ABC-transporter-like signaling protein FtsE [hydrothermal vent metagenome]|uniref:Cell-division-associated, ABC-transporter-like signaling protein FtsE n=1 Tax=hydrothermal vent metagenome TaxID=652676 RepID=A0A3B0T8Z4_9ZZZZ
MAENPIIELIDANIYQRENLVLTGINLRILEGEFVYVIGRVGSGKTSLIKTLNAEIPLIQGEGKVAGFSLKRIKHTDTAYLRRKLGVVFQDFRLLSDRNIYSNLEFVLKATGWKQGEAVKNRIREVLGRVNMASQMNKMPHQLSGGEQQRIVIARAILNDPPIILADEPTGNLDPETSEEILNLLLELNKAGKTIVMASHDYALLEKHKARTLVCKDMAIQDSAEKEAIVDFDMLMDEKRNG